MRPLIGVTTSELRPGSLATLQRAGAPPHPEIMLGTTYLRAIDAAGAIPVILSPVDLAAVPELWGAWTASASRAGPTSTRSPTAPARATRCSARRTPASTRSSSPSPAPPMRADSRCWASAAAPRRSTSRAAGRCTSTSTATARPSFATVTTQSVSVAADSLLATVTGSGPTLAVNSFHHQAVDVPGAGLRVVARAPDGTAEAIEDRARPFVLAVQWHAETLTERPEHGALFTALVQAAGARPLRLAAAA